MCLPSGGDGDGGAAAARQREEERQAKIRMGTNSVNDIFSQFNEGFFQRNLANPYLDFALPQFQEQRKGAFEDLVFGLAQRGMLNSSAGARARNEFNNFADRQYQGLQDQARQRIDTGLAEVEQSRSNIIQNLNATADAQGAIQAANNQASLLGRAPSFNPLGALFANFSSTFLNNRNQNSGGINPGSGSGVTLYGGGGGSAGSGRTVG